MRVVEAERTNATIDELAAVANEIGNVTGLISAIAGQTNLLALNATIEAARAGECGRGFAVVAQEVKALAGQTATATQEIERRIQAMQSATGRSVEAIQAISGTIRELDRFSARIADAVEQQAMAAREIAGNATAAAGERPAGQRRDRRDRQGGDGNVESGGAPRPPPQAASARRPKRSRRGCRPSPTVSGRRAPEPRARLDRTPPLR